MEVSVIEFLKTYPNINTELSEAKFKLAIIAIKGQWATRFSRPNTLYGWDCETLLVLNFNAIDLDSMEKYKE